MALTYWKQTNSDPTPSDIPPEIGAKWLNTDTNTIWVFVGTTPDGQAIWEVRGFRPDVAIAQVEAALTSELTTLTQDHEALKNYVFNTLGVNIVKVTSDYILESGVGIVLVDATNNDVTVSFPDDVPKGHIVNVKRIDNSTNVVKVTCPTGQIDGQSEVTIDNQYDSYTFVCDADGNWWIL